MFTSLMVLISCSWLINAVSSRNDPKCLDIKCSDTKCLECLDARDIKDICDSQCPRMKLCHTNNEWPPIKTRKIQEKREETNPDDVPDRNSGTLDLITPTTQGRSHFQLTREQLQNLERYALYDYYMRVRRDSDL